MKKHVVEEMRNAKGMSEADAQRAYEDVVHAMHAAIKKHGEVRLAPIGTLKVKHRAERMGRNPATGESVKIAGKDVIGFKMARGALDGR